MRSSSVSRVGPGDDRSAIRQDVVELVATGGEGVAAGCRMGCDYLALRMPAATLALSVVLLGRVREAEGVFSPQVQTLTRGPERLEGEHGTRILRMRRTPAGDP
jgi:hypothetical protein